MRSKALVSQGAHAAFNRPFSRRLFRPMVEMLESRLVPSMIDYGAGFANHSGLSANGTAAFTGSVAQLTDGHTNEAGSFFTNSSFDITQFTTSFTFVQNPGVTSTTGNGLTFTIQGNGPGALGADAGGLGYQGIPNSVALKFDLPSDSTGIFTQTSVSMAGSGIDLRSQDPMAVNLTYDGSTLTESVLDTVTGKTFTQSYTVNIAGIIGSQMAYLGFTGATGQDAAVQDIKTWTGTFGAANAPTLTSISANSVREGSPGIPLTLTGSNFALNSTAQWNGTNLVTSFLTSSGLTALIPASLLTEEGTASVTVFNPDSNSTSNALTFTITDAPLLGTPASFSPTEGTPFSGVVATFTDVNTNAPVTDFTATINWGNGTTSTGTIASLGSASFSVTGTNTYAQAGTFTVAVVITDVGGSTTTVNSTINVASPPPPISLTTESITATEGEGFSGAVATFTDTNPNATPASYSVVLITWGDGQQSTGTVAINPNGGFEVVASHIYAEEGSYSLQVLVQSITGDSASGQSAAQVADAPLSASAVAINPTLGSPFTGVVATFTDANANAPVSDFSATISWGNGNTSAGTITSLGGGSFSVTGTNTYVQSGTFTLSVSITDDGGSSATALSTANVPGTSLPINLTADSINGTEGEGFTGVVATFTDASPNATPASYSVVLLTWGDGEESTGTVAFNPNGGFEVLGSHTYAEEGSYSLQVFVESATGATATGNSTAQVADAPLSATGTTINLSPNTPFTGVVATFTDANSNAPVSDFTATINWGNGNITLGTIISTGSGSFSVSGTIAYAQAGTFTVSVAITDDGGSSAAAFSTANVAGSSLPITLTAESINATEGEGFSGVVATFTDASPNATPASYSVVLITWGDGQQSTGTLAANPNGGFEVVGSHIYAEEGSYTLQVQVQSITGASASGQSAAQVADAPLFATGTTINLSAGTTITGVVASFTDANSNPDLSDFSATISWGNGTTSAGTITQNANGSFSVSGSNTYGTAATYSILVVITDRGGSTATAATTANVGVMQTGDQPLVATGQNITATVGGAEEFTVAEFTDPDPSAQTGTYAVAIHWGDGTAVDPGTVTQPGGKGTPFFVTYSHTYNQIGTFTVVVQIFDEAGAYAETSSTATVNSGGGAARSSRGGSILLPGSIRPANTSLVGAEPVVTKTGAQQGPETSQQSEQPGRLEEMYWAILYHEHGDQIADPNGGAAQELALALGGTAV